MKERIIHIINTMFGKHKSKFAKSLSISPGNVGDWVSGRSEPTAKLILRMHKIHNINPTWLITGKGPILSTDTAAVSENISPAIDTINDVSGTYIRQAENINYDDLFRNLEEKEQVRLVFKVMYDWSIESKQLLQKTLEALLEQKVR